MPELLAGTQRALLRRLAVDQSENRVPSIVAAVVRDGAPVWIGARGQVDGAEPTADTQYRIGSITKTFVAALIMRLRDEGRLDLNDPLDRFVPGTPAGASTIAQLLSHTAGLTAESPGEWWERTPGVPADELISLLDKQSMPHRPGRRFHYSNLGFGLLGEVIARSRGMSWMEAVEAEILRPLGMGRTTFLAQAPHAQGYAVHPWADVLLPEPSHDGGAMAPAGQLWSTATDLARWAAFLGGDTGEVLHPDTVAEMREPAIVDDADEWRGGHGLGLQLMRHKGRRVAGHTGSMPGFLATVWVDPKDSTGVLFLANTTAGGGYLLLTDYFDIMAEREPRVPGTWTPMPQSEVDSELLALTGQWYWGPSAYALRLRKGGLLDLTPINGRGRASRFRRDDNGAWIGLDGYYAGEELRIVRGADGAVSHLDLNTFIFTRTPYDPNAAVPGGVDADGWRGL
ncbi:serine hydrolase domain-containing protein [Allokutzneria albata]|uniref:CubicO group peptidase, beta-lactamase class C family n=1 Tax=Allokutzneria albata TaxID=211114 RepID=A0A1G9ZM80_ALLAB|nr:serine hydrolase domain-containing protein [Allokutzneria albata]SDN21663.1 CubicO group peptidase, beta-lactamase class C family [Allokutzneria albata]